MKNTVLFLSKNIHEMEAPTVKTRKCTEVTESFQILFKDRHPKILRTDAGSEFICGNLKQFINIDSQHIYTYILYLFYNINRNTEKPIFSLTLTCILFIRMIFIFTNRIILFFNILISIIMK